MVGQRQWLATASGWGTPVVLVLPCSACTTIAARRVPPRCEGAVVRRTASSSRQAPRFRAFAPDVGASRTACAARLTYRPALRLRTLPASRHACVRPLLPCSVKIIIRRIRGLHLSTVFRRIARRSGRRLPALRIDPLNAANLSEHTLPGVTGS